MCLSFLDIKMFNHNLRETKRQSISQSSSTKKKAFEADIPIRA